MIYNQEQDVASNLNAKIPSFPAAFVPATFTHHLIDAYASATTEDAWDWSCSQIENELLFEGFEPLDMAELQKSLERGQGLGDKRGYICLEILETEQNYTFALIFAQKVYRAGLKERHICSDAVLDLIFRGMDDLIPLHLQLLQDLKNAIKTWNTHKTLIGQLFLKHHNSFVKLYGAFISSFVQSTKTEKQQLINPDYVAFIAQTVKIAESKKQELKDILIMPVQRIGRYPLHLRELLKNTDFTHVDYANLNLACDSVKELADIVNQKKRDQEERSSLFDAYTETKNCPPNLVSSRRRYLMDVSCVQVDIKKQKRDVHLTLFSDLLMVSAPVKTMFKHSGFKFLAWIDLLEIRIDVSNETVVIGIDRANASFTRPTLTIMSEIAAKDFIPLTVIFSGMGNAGSFVKSLLIEVKKSQAEELILLEALKTRRSKLGAKSMSLV